MKKYLTSDFFGNYTSPDSPIDNLQANLVHLPGVQGSLTESVVNEMKSWEASGEEIDAIKAELINRAVMMKYESVFAIDAEMENDVYPTMVQRVYIRIANWLYGHVEPFARKLLLLRQQTEKGLLGQVTSNTESGNRVNDTPDGNGKLADYFGDDKFASRIEAGKSSSGTDFDTPMARVREIVDSYPDLVSGFADEFERRFALYPLDFDMEEM